MVVRWNLRIAAAIALAVTVGLIRAQASEFYLGPAGNDGNPGTVDRPWATLGGARDALRALRARHALGNGPVTVWLRGGDYPQAQTLTFSAADSGASAAAPVIFAAVPRESVRLTGAARIMAEWFQPVSDRSPDWSRLDPAARAHILVADLRAHGLGGHTLLPGSLDPPRGFALRADAPPELFCGDRPMTLARWPNVGEPFARTAAAQSPTRFQYRGDRPARWVREPDARLHGFWAQDWADFEVRVQQIDPATRSVTLAFPPAQYGLGSNRPFIAYNLLCELDRPGEYYLDRPSGLLYFWPPDETWPRVGLELSVLEKPVLETTDAQFIAFRGLTFAASRGPLVSVVGGSAIDFLDCRFHGAGQYAAAIGGRDSGLDRCLIEDCGAEGVRLSGGDRASLSPGRNFVRNCTIRRTGESNWTYKPAISFEGGCGNLATHNLIEDLPHAAILLSGNNHLIAYNEIRRVCRWTGDSGAIYAGMNWGFRGNRIEFNYLHDIASELGPADVNGIYLDDCMSGVKVFGNVLARISGTAIFCGGGRDNVMTNNLIVECGTAHYDDDRGRARFSTRPGDGWNLLEKLSAEHIQYQRAPWSQAYPACAVIPDSAAKVTQGRWLNPEHSIFAHNVGWGNRHWMKEENDSHTGVFSVYDSVADNQADLAPFFDPAGPRTGELAPPVQGFTAIPFGAIGPEQAEPMTRFSPAEKPKVTASASGAQPGSRS